MIYTGHLVTLHNETLGGYMGRAYG